jgi:hypothetical protein
MTGSTSNVGRTAPTESVGAAVRRSRDTLTQSIRWLAFWTAIGLPAIYLPALYFGIGANTGAVVVGLLGVQLLALRAGHSYHP